MYYVVDKATNTIIDSDFNEVNPQEMADFYETDVYIIEGERGETVLFKGKPSSYVKRIKRLYDKIQEIRNHWRIVSMIEERYM